MAALQTLVDGRAEAWETGDVSVLDEVLAAGSPALATERATLQQVDEQAVAYQGVDFSVDEAAVVEDADGRLTIDAVVTRAALRGVDADGQTVVDEPPTTERVRLVLSRPTGSDPWLLWSWAPG